MSIEKRYFRYHFNKQLPVFLITAALSLWMVFSSSFYQYESVFDDVVETEILLSPTTTILLMMSMFMPAVELSMFKKRRDLDNLFSLPIAREKMLGIHFLTGLIINSSVFVLNVLTVLLGCISVDVDPSALPILIPYCLFGLLWGTVLYGFFTFIFYEANTSTDGVLFIMAHSFVLTVFFGGLSLFLDMLNLPYKWLATAITLSPAVPLYWISSVCVNVLDPEDNYFTVELETYEGIFATVVFLVIGIVATVAFFRNCKKKRTEHVGEISESWFGYKTLLPLLLFPLFTFASFSVISVFALTSTFVGYLIYRRGLHFKASDWIIMGCLAGYGIILVPLITNLAYLFQ